MQTATTMSSPKPATEAPTPAEPTPAELAARHHYPLMVRWDPADSLYIVTCPAFPGMSSFGETRTEAVASGEEALGMFIEEFIADGVALPDEQHITY